MQDFVNVSAAGPVTVLNRDGQSCFVLICEHASNYIPTSYARLGLTVDDLQRHIAWDIGALALSEQLSSVLDAPLIAATHSRLLLDLNRDPRAADSIVVRSEDTPIPGNTGISMSEKQRRVDWLYTPFHAAIETLIDARLAAAIPTVVISVHSFTPVYRGCIRPWHAGVISQRDRRLADSLLKVLQRNRELVIGDNQPYAPNDGVYHSIERHGERRGLLCAMLEIRNDLITHDAGQRQWAVRLASDLKLAVEDFSSAVDVEEKQSQYSAIQLSH